MPRSLVIVESPAKARTIKKYLGKGFEVKASMGHIKDLPEKELGVEIEDQFRPRYHIIKGKRKVIKELKASAKNVQAVYLAADPDREGEAIAWHVAQELEGDDRKIYRIRFNEITQRSITAAMEKPDAIDMSRVNAQQARRIMDRLVGYQVSPFLWRTLYRGREKLHWNSQGRHLLFDLDSDPGENRNLASQRPQRVGELGQELRSYLGSLPQPPEAAEGVVDDETKRALESLGYVK